MKFTLTSLIGLLCLSLVLASATMASDPGIPDTVKISGGPLILNQSTPLTFTIVNDELVGGYSLGLVFEAASNGFARFDSAVYINRMADPNVLPMRIESLFGTGTHGATPDSVLFGGQRVAASGLPIGNDAIAEFYFTGLSLGSMRIFDAFFPPAGEFLIVDIGGTNLWAPYYADYVVDIIESSQPPTVSVPSGNLLLTFGDDAEFAVTGYSPEGYPITLSILSFTGYDDETVLPTNSPTLTTGNPGQFSWASTSADIGIWQAVVQVCDTAGKCDEADVVIQVVEDAVYILDFDVDETVGVCRTSGLVHGNFDDDDAPEIFLSSSHDPTAEAYDFNGTGFDKTYTGELDFPKFGPQIGYFNTDNYLDVLAMRWDGYVYRTMAFLGDDAGSFTTFYEGNDGEVTRSTALGEFTGDNHLDYASVWYPGLKIFTGNQTQFTFSKFIDTPDSALSVNSADFNDDGYDDLAVGTTAGINIYLNDGAGDFDLSNSYSQTYGSKEIKVTNQGSDFNNDDVFDLCISTPSVGGAFSEMILYTGNGDGSFVQNITRTVKGQIYGNCTGDINNDGELDIVFVNGAREYVSILFGDGDGQFTNEIRFPVPHPSPSFVDCIDIDLDGDLDLVIAANGVVYASNSLFVFLNQLDPEEYVNRSFAIEACDNAEIDLTSATGKVLNCLKSTIPSGDYFRRNIDANDYMDDYTTMGTVEDGEYRLKVTPQPYRVDTAPFSLEFVLEGQRYRLAADLPMNSEGYVFGVYAGAASAILPRPGSFVGMNPPVFSWQTDGPMDFQLATDIGFTDLIVDELVADASYTPETELAIDGETTYFWRIKPHGSPDYESVYVINMVSGGADCGDANADGDVTVGDAVYLINYTFKSGPAPSPLLEGDVNCDSKVDVGDIVYLISFIFRGGASPCCL